MIIKKIAAAVLTVAMAAVAFTGCSKTYEKVVTVDGVDIAPGNYLLAQYQAYLAAGELVGDDSVDLLDTLIEDTDSKEWMHNKTIENLKLQIWTDSTFDEMGLELTQEELDYIDSQVEYYWEYVQEEYVPNGIGMETYRKNAVNSYKLEMIFAALYGEGGAREPSDEEYKAYMATQFARIKGFELPKTDAQKNFVTAQQLVQIVAYCEEAVAELNSGADFEATQVKYMTLAGELMGDETDYSDVPVQYTQQRFLSKSKVESGEEMLTANAFVMDVNGEFAYDETNEGFIIYQRVENTTDAKELDYYKSQLIGGMKGEEFAEYSAAQASGLSVVEDTASVKFHSLEKIK
ncbi:MAG: hypothetical protein IJ339_02560 [Oscillospiraceae bacterium]|nr:hypothetical protein [Oscillospiraceae bacterium]